MTHDDLGVAPNFHGFDSEFKGHPKPAIIASYSASLLVVLNSNLKALVNSSSSRVMSKILAFPFFLVDKPST
jgi:hypothetical protein